MPNSSNRALLDTHQSILDISPNADDPDSPTYLVFRPHHANAPMLMHVLEEAGVDPTSSRMVIIAVTNDVIEQIQPDSVELFASLNK